MLDTGRNKTKIVLSITLCFNWSTNRTTLHCLHIGIISIIIKSYTCISNKSIIFKCKLSMLLKNNPTLSVLWYQAVFGT